MADRCLLLLARAGDGVVRALQQQAPARVAHASIADLTRAGWRYESGRPEQAAACASGRVIAAEHIAAVVCRIPVVVPSDLPHVHREDRAYVAAEINAFLYAWLAQFTGVRFNEPSWASLAGPAWHALQWTWFVARLGVPVANSSLVAAGATRSATIRATVVGDDVFDVADPVLVEYARRIARAARAELLAVTFVHRGEWRFLSADPCPDLDSAGAEALLARAFAPGLSPSIESWAGLCVAV